MRYDTLYSWIDVWQGSGLVVVRDVDLRDDRWLASLL